MAFFVPLTRSRRTAQSLSFVSSFAFLAMTPREEEMIVFVAKREKEKYRRLTRDRIEEEEDKEEQTFRLYAGALVLLSDVSRFRRSNRRISRDSRER